MKKKVKITSSVNGATYHMHQKKQRKVTKTDTDRNITIIYANFKWIKNERNMKTKMFNLILIFFLNFLLGKQHVNMHSGAYSVQQRATVSLELKMEVIWMLGT